METSVKYYIPEISEFHVGFECELRNSSNEPYDWEPFKIIGVDDAEISGSLMDWSFYDSANAIKDEMVRVKYLDKEDNESFEFMEDTEAAPIEDTEHIKFEKHYVDRQGRLMNLELSWMWLNDQPFILLSECEENSENDFEILFQGYCKNKSQLKLILQWTGILKI